MNLVYNDTTYAQRNIDVKGAVVLLYSGKSEGRAYTFHGIPVLVCVCTASSSN